MVHAFNWRTTRHEFTLFRSNDHKSIKDYIVVMRSPRYRNIFINYNFLNNIKDKIICIGLKQEYEDLKKASIILNFMIVKIF